MPERPVAKQKGCLSRRQALESGGVKGRQAVAMHAACVYMACRLEHNPRTFKEILAGAPGTSKVCDACLGCSMPAGGRHRASQPSWQACTAILAGCNAGFAAVDGVLRCT